MAKLTLSDLDNLNNQTTAVANINNNNILIEAALENTLSRDGSTPNTMNSSLDMNSNRIINLPDPVANQEPVTLAFGLANYGDSLTNSNNAAASATAAASSATSASGSATAAAASATTASTQATNSATSATASAASATASANSAAVALTSQGFKYSWLSATTNSDPGSGAIKFNNATIGSVTSIYISETDANANNLSALISDWGSSSSTNKAIITVQKGSSPGTVWADFYVTAAITDNGTWDTLTVTYKAGPGGFANSDDVYIKADLVGDKGATGASGNATMSGVTTHGVGIVSGATTMASTAVMTDGQLLVGQSAADPLPKTVSGDATMAASGALTVTKSNGTNLTSLFLQTANNLSDVTASTARTNLGLGSIATFAETTAAQYQANTSGKALSTDKVWSAAAVTTLTDGATVTPDFSTGFDFIWTIGAAGRTLANPSNPKAGQKGVIYLVQDATGSRTITSWGSQYKFPQGIKPTLSTAASSIDVLSYWCKSTTEIHCVLVGNNFS